MLDTCIQSLPTCCTLRLVQSFLKFIYTTDFILCVRRWNGFEIAILWGTRACEGFLGPHFYLSGLYWHHCEMTFWNTFYGYIGADCKETLCFNGTSIDETMFQPQDFLWCLKFASCGSETRFYEKLAQALNSQFNESSHMCLKPCWDVANLKQICLCDYWHCGRKGAAELKTLVAVLKLKSPSSFVHLYSHRHVSLYT